jgi:hypothetical protein
LYTDGKLRTHGFRQRLQTTIRLKFVKHVQVAVFCIAITATWIQEARKTANNVPSRKRGIFENVYLLQLKYPLSSNFRIRMRIARSVAMIAVTLREGDWHIVITAMLNLQLLIP